MVPPDDPNAPLPVARPTRDDSDDRPPRPDAGREALGAIVPLDVSPWSLISCYTGLLGMCLPPFALIAVPCGIIALRQRKRKRATYGSVTSDARAVIGLVCGGIGLCFGVLILVLMALEKPK